MVFSPKYRGKIPIGEVAETVEEIICQTCKEMNIQIIDMAVNADLFLKVLSKHPAFSRINPTGSRMQG